jgi:hypothetical protein
MRVLSAILQSACTEGSRVENAQPLWDRSAAISLSNRVSTDVQAANELCRLFQEAAALEPQIEAIEALLFSELQSLVSEPQSSLVEVVRMRRERVRAQQVRSPFPAYPFDFDVLMLEMSQQGLDLTPVDTDTFEGLLMSWRHAATTLHQQHARLRRAAIAENTLFPARLNAMVAKDGPTQEAYAFAEEQYRVAEPPTQAARRLFDLNQQYVALVAAQLPADAGQYLRARFEVVAFPALFPDPANSRRAVRRRVRSEPVARSANGR